MNISHWLVGGARAKLNGNVLKKIPLTLPIYEEQIKIGGFFKQLDDTIALHQQKLEVTKQFKQTMLKKMFPRNGETTPEIRFKGFTDDWEKCKLKDLCSLSTGKLDANAMTSDGKYSFFTSGEKVYKTDTFAFDGDAILIAGNGNVGLQHTYRGKFNAYQRTYVLMDFKLIEDIQKDSTKFLNINIYDEIYKRVDIEISERCKTFSNKYCLNNKIVKNVATLLKIGEDLNDSTGNLTFSNELTVAREKYNKLNPENTMNGFVFNPKVKKEFKLFVENKVQPFYEFYRDK